MPPRTARDEWLLPTLEKLAGREAVDALREKATDSFWDAAVRAKLASDDDIVQALAKRFRVKAADLSVTTPAARQLVPEALARKYRVLPLAATDSFLEIATADPNDLDCERALAFATGRTVRMLLAPPARIVERIDEVYRPENAVDRILAGVTARYEIESLNEAADEVEMDLASEGAAKRPVIQLVDHIVAEAIATRASDIHIEPEEGGVVVRYRIDGVLRDAMTLPRAAGLPLVSRIKIMAQLDITDRMRPQDGRARVQVTGARIDLRISTLPASHGEKVVIRILDGRGSLLSLDGLGLDADEHERLSHLTNLREGIVLVTGPTGSGKTTTLYSALRTIQQRQVNIVTVEDPVEYKLGGVVQVQVNEKAELTFASALRSILRQDPDVILVGEIRDKETSTIAIQASLTGHLVLSTLHTIDAVSSFARLLDIGTEPFKLAASVKGIVAQRLLRRVCPDCRVRETDPVSPRLSRWLGDAELWKAVGCAECSQTGYRGRMAIMEILITTPEVERLVATGATADQVVDAAREGGMRTLWESGVRRVVEGDTTLDELLRVVEPPLDLGGHESNGNGRGRRRGSPSPAKVQPSVAAPAAVAVVAAPAVPSFTAEFDLVDAPIGGAAESAGVVLLVEDEEPLRRVLRDILEHEGFEVVEAADGVQALDEVDRSAPDIVVLDLHLPRLDGFGVLSRLRSRPATATLPVVVLTAKGEEDNEVRVFESGADDFLAKPFRPRALGARLRALLKRS